MGSYRRAAAAFEINWQTLWRWADRLAGAARKLDPFLLSSSSPATWATPPRWLKKQAGGNHGGGEDPRWREVAGAAVEITLADGYLIVGGNQVSKGMAIGHLSVLRLGAPVTLRVKDAARGFSNRVDAAQRVRVSATVELAEGDAPLDTGSAGAGRVSPSGAGCGT